MKVASCRDACAEPLIPSPGREKRCHRPILVRVWCFCAALNAHDPLAGAHLTMRTTMRTTMKLPSLLRRLVGSLARDPCPRLCRCAQQLHCCLPRPRQLPSRRFVGQAARDHRQHHVDRQDPTARAASSMTRLANCASQVHAWKEATAQKRCLPLAMPALLLLLLQALLAVLVRPILHVQHRRHPRQRAAHLSQRRARAPQSRLSGCRTRLGRPPRASDVRAQSAAAWHRSGS